MIGRRSVLIYVANLVSALLGYVGFFVIVRFVPNATEVLGLVGFGLGFVGSFFVLTSLGVPRAHIKRVSQGEPLDRCIGAYALLQALQVSLATGATFLALFVWTEVLGRGFETGLQVQIIYVMLLYYLAMSAANVGMTTFNARLETAKTQTGQIVGTVIRVIGMVAVAAAGLGAIALAWAYVAGAASIAIVALLFLRRYRVSLPSMGLIRSYVRFALPLAVPAGLVALSVNVDKALIQLFWGAEQVGYYFTAQRITLMLTVITSAVSILLFPTISRYHAENELEMLRSKSREAERYLSMILAPVVAFLIVYPEAVIHVLLSDAFLPAVNILRIFALSVFVMALIVPRVAILQGMDRAQLSGIASLAGAVTTLVLYPLLIPTSIFGFQLAGLGPEGAALSVLAGYGVLLAAALIFANRLVGDRLHRPLALHLAAAAIVAFAFVQLIPPALGLEWRWFQLIAVGAAFLGAYTGLLAAMREFRRPDLLLFLEVIDPRKMAKYVGGELRGGGSE